jgi:hypothetical protein
MMQTLVSLHGRCTVPLDGHHLVIIDFFIIHTLLEVVSKLFWITTSVWPFPEATCSTGSSSKSGSISWSNVFMCCRYLCFIVLESGFVSSQRSNTEIKFVQKWWSSLSGVAHGNFSSSFLEIYTERLTNCRLATLHLHVILDHTF